MTLPLVMLLVFGSAKLLAELFESLNQPGIVGEILAGVILGPSLLSLVRPEGIVESLGELGVMFLLFRVGLEIRSSELGKIGGMAALVACGGVVASLALVGGLFWFSGAKPLETMFIAASMAATSAGISAQVLSSRGLLALRTSRVVLAAAVIDDVCGLLVLAVVSGLAHGGLNAAGIASTVGFASAFIFIVARWGGPVMRRLKPGVESLRIAEAEFSVTVGLLFALAALSAYTGVAALVGAFLAGLALADTAGDRVRTLVHGATELLVPFFLVGIGLRVNVLALRGWHSAILAVLVLAAALFAKVGGCGAGALALGRGDALRVGMGMIPRGEVTMVVAQLGLTLGVVSPENFGVVVLVAVATTLAAPPLIQMAHVSGRPGESLPQ